MNYSHKHIGLVTAFLLTACGGGESDTVSVGGPGTGNSNTVVATVTVSGVAVKGPLIEAEVQAFSVGAEGTLKPEGKGVLTDENGRLSVTLPSSSQPGVIQVTTNANTKMVDDVTFRTITAPAGLTLRTMVGRLQEESSGVSANPFTDLAVNLAQSALDESGNPIPMSEQTVLAAKNMISQQLGDVDAFRYIPPAAVSDEVTLDQKTMLTLLAGIMASPDPKKEIAQLAPELRLKRLPSGTYSYASEDSRVNFVGRLNAIQSRGYSALPVKLRRLNNFNVKPTPASFEVLQGREALDNFVEVMRQGYRQAVSLSDNKLLEAETRLQKLTFNYAEAAVNALEVVNEVNLSLNSQSGLIEACTAVGFGVSVSLSQGVCSATKTAGSYRTITKYEAKSKADISVSTLAQYRGTTYRTAEFTLTSTGSEFSSETFDEDVTSLVGNIVITDRADDGNSLVSVTLKNVEINQPRDRSSLTLKGVLAIETNQGDQIGVTDLTISSTRVETDAGREFEIDGLSALLVGVAADQKIASLSLGFNRDIFRQDFRRAESASNFSPIDINLNLEISESASVSAQLKQESFDGGKAKLTVRANKSFFTASGDILGLSTSSGLRLSSEGLKIVSSDERFIATVDSNGNGKLFDKTLQIGVIERWILKYDGREVSLF